ncbi:MAG: carbamoyltransferase [Planctomycetes bacterium]|nr:carbamoyltransferase [Planctomycetota bacterium]
MSVILGINTFHAGSSAAILIDGNPVAAVAEERLNRIKYYANFPVLAVRKCLEMAGLKIGDVDAVALGRDSAANRAKKIGYALKNPTKLLNLLKIKASRRRVEDLKTLIASQCEFDPAELRFAQYHIEHHLAHIASAFYVSGWDKAAGLSIDGSGDFVTAMMAECEGHEIRVKNRIYVPHSLGSMYTMICEFIGYRKYGDEGKIMGLAPYGSDAYCETFDDMVRLSDSQMSLNLKYFLPFGANQGVTLNEKGQMVIGRPYSDDMVQLFGEPRDPDAEITKREEDLAYGLQHKFEEVYVHLLNIAHRLAPSERVAIAGGCALNSCANGKIFDHTPFRETFIQPAAGDEGLALGAALYVSRAILKEPASYMMKDAFLGPEFSESEIKGELEHYDVKYVRHDRAPLIEATVDEIETGNVVGWFQGRMEWGPRALGNRSIVVHPGLPNMKDILNARIKRREPFRPFAPSLLAERQGDIFEHTHPSPFMLHVYKIKPAWQERLCAVNHVDNTGRLQSVTRAENPLYYDLIKAFEARTGVPVVLNTSFNENEPIVCRPAEAIECFQRTKMDVLAIGPFFCKKEQSQ